MLQWNTRDISTSKHKNWIKILTINDWERSVFIPVPKKANAEECSDYHTISLISHVSKVMLKILKVKLQQFVNHELSDVQTRFRKGRGTRERIANIH